MMAALRFRRLYYLPLEIYAERYTYQLSRATDGWMVREFKRIGINFTRIDSVHGPEQQGGIKVGVALDATRRTEHCFSQVARLLDYMQKGVLTSEDVIYLDDFWTPGIEQVPYMAHLLGIDCPRIYANCWAQSVDEYDFTHAMRRWMRPIEQGYAELYAGVFCATHGLRQLLLDAGVGTPDKVHPVGHPWNTAEVQSRMNFNSVRSEDAYSRQPRVLFTSRWDTEKDPTFFLKVASLVREYNDNVQFVVCTGQPKLRSNDPWLLARLEQTQERLPAGALVVREGLTKAEYYDLLRRSMVQLNTAKQDWISYTLLETSAAGCFPLYPRFRSFPEALNGDEQFLYTPGDVKECAAKLLDIIDGEEDHWTYAAMQRRAWIHERYDSSIERMLHIMGCGFAQHTPYPTNPVPDSPV